jgi:uridine kinase
MKKSYLIGICGGSASGKTTVAQSIIERLEMPWVLSPIFLYSLHCSQFKVTILSMDSFYKVCTQFSLTQFPIIIKLDSNSGVNRRTTHFCLQT